VLGHKAHVADFNAKSDCASELHTHVVHAATLLLAESTVPSLGLNLQGSLEEELGEGRAELDAALSPELGFEITDTLIEDGDRHLDSEQSLEDSQDLQLAPG